MSSALSRFQDGFAQALLAVPADGAQEPFALARQAGFAVYRNTVLKGLVDALQANYPAVARLVGEDWFRAAAALHARSHTPADGRLMLYGAGFADFLDAFAPAADLPYLSGVARLDRCWSEAHAAADAKPLPATALLALPLAQLAALVLRPHPAARWRWFDGMPIFTLWQRQRDAQEHDLGEPLAWQAEGALITRPAAAVQWQQLSAGGCAFLDACAAGRTLSEAAAQAQTRQADIELDQLMSLLLQAGAFCAGPAGTGPFNPKETP
jgi:hypothetical protein